MSGFWSTLDKLSRQSPLKLPSGNSLRGTTSPAPPAPAAGTQRMSIVPAAPAPVAPLPPSKKDSAICETAVALASSAGLPFWLREPAYQLCVRTLPHAKSLGYKSFNSLVKTLAGKIESRFMAGNKVTKAPRVVSKQVATTGGKLAAAPKGFGMAPPSYARSTRQAPAAFSVRQRGTGRPRVKSSSAGLMITHSEMVGNLVSNTSTLAYAAYGFVANPGKFSTFPWLSTLASNFDKYIMHKLVVHLVSNQPTSTGGKIGIGFDYDSTDPLPTDRNEFFSMTHHVECAPWDTVSLNVPLDLVPRFVNSHTLTDSKLIDCGNIVVMADQIVATATAVADIIVEYTVELLEPQQAVYSTMTLSANNQATFGAATITGPVVGTLLTGSSSTIAEFQLPQGYYSASVYAYDSGAGSPAWAIAGHNCTGTNYYANPSTSYSVGMALCKVVLPDGRLKFTLSGTTLANTEVVTLVISRISAAVYNGAAYQASLSAY